MQTMINENFIELISGIAIATVLVMYILLKISQKKEDSQYEEEIETKDKAVEKDLHTEEKKPEAEIKPEEEQNIPAPINRKKREVVPHDKIKKDDFSIFKNVKVLIAEDNIINQKVITSLLSGSGIHTTIANDGQECLNILEGDSDFSVIFMDAHMPIIDGFQATRLIRQNQNYNHIPIVALSGDTAADDIKNMINVGMEAHLEKPLKMDALYDVLYTYTTGNESEDSSKKPIDKLVEFDIGIGLDICGGDKEFYLEILNDFISKYSDSAQKLQNYINNTNGADADKMLLDISGIAANIGADHLHQIAIELKSSIANPNDLEYISNLKKYKRSLQQVCEAIREYKTS